MCMAEQRLVASGHILASSTPHSPSSKGHLSEPDSPTDVAAAVRPKGGAPKHNTSAMMYYRHATQRQQQQASQQQLPRTGSLHDAESAVELITAAHDLDSSSLTAQLHDLHQQQQQALLSGHPGQIRVPAEGSSPVRNGTANSSGEGHGPSVCANIESIQNVLTALFLASMGLIMSPVFLWHHATVLLWGTLVVTLLKAGVVTLVVRMFDVPLRLSLAVGLSMAHIGEFSFVLLSMASQLKLLSAQVSLAGVFASCPVLAVPCLGRGGQCLLCSVEGLISRAGLRLGALLRPAAGRLQVHNISPCALSAIFQVSAKFVGAKAKRTMARLRGTSMCVCCWCRCTCCCWE